MNDSLYIAATGMQAQQLAVDTIANNLVNVNSPGFKKGRVAFTDLMMREAMAAQVGAGQTGPLAAVPRLGAGVGIASVAKSFHLGEMRQTGGAMDVAILGDGFLEVTMPDGGVGYTRGGTLKVSPEGLLTSAAGHPLRPGISIPAGATAVAIDSKGHVLVSSPNHPGPVDAGRLQLVRFANPGGLLAQGDGEYRASEASGESIAGRPGEDGVGAIAQGMLEGSNVKLVDEMVELVVAQRAYEASVKVVQASDEMMALVNGLRR